MSWVHNVHGYARLAEDLIAGRPNSASVEDLSKLAERVQVLRGLYAKEYKLQEEFIGEGIRNLAGVDLAQAQKRNLEWQHDMGVVLLRVDAALRKRGV